ncbi:hypothetical protein [Halobacteriovorax marinus]
MYGTLKLFFFSLILFLSSCSQIKYTSSENIPTYFAPKKHHSRKASHSGVRRFYLWGLVPPQHTVDVDNELQNDGLISAARIEIREYQEFMDVFWTYVTLGLYKPVRYEIKGYGVKE